MVQRTPLEADWRVMQHEPGLAFGRGTSTTLTPAERRWVPATVPGDVHLDYLRAGIIEDPFVGRNADHCRWIAENDWWYQADIVAPPHRTGQRVFLDFEGLDTFATVYLDGEVIGRHQNAFRPLRIDVTDLIGPAGNQLRVQLASPMGPPGRDLGDPDVIAYGPRRRPHSRRTAMWAFHLAPWIETIGIYRPVSWIVADDLEIEDVFVRTVALNEDGSAELEVLVEVARHGGPVAPVEVDLQIAGHSRTVRMDIGWDGGSVTERIIVPDAPLWWPSGHGGQPMLERRATIRRDGTELDSLAGRFGIRTVRLAQEPDPDGGISFRLEVNGKPIFLKGFNWVPVDALTPRVEDDQYRRLLTAAKEANANALRVNGFGLYETDVFYELCDELGILVAQDFMFADAAYPHDGAFLEECRLEAEYQVRRLRRHPSIAWWCGDNENDQVVVRDLGKADYPRNRLNKRVLAQAVRTHAPGTPYIYSSPNSPDDDDQNLATQGTSHLWSFSVRWDDPAYADLRPRMVMEIGMLAMPNREVVEKMLGGAPEWPVFTDTYFSHMDDSRNVRAPWWDILFATIRAVGWDDPVDLDDLIRKTQALQSEATRYWVELYSSQPTCWGIFFWCLNDAHPTMSNSFISYPFSPKPALADLREVFGAIDR